MKKFLYILAFLALPTIIVAAPLININQVNYPGYVLLMKSDGTSKNFNITANTDAARGQALSNAVDVATAGDIIQLSAGTFATSSLVLATGVKLQGSSLQKTIISGNTLAFTSKQWTVYASGQNLITDLQITNSDISQGAALKIGNGPGNGYGVDIIVRNVRLGGGYDGFQVYGTGTNDPEIIFDNVSFDTGNSFDGGNLAYGNLTIRNSTIEFNPGLVDDDGAAGFIYNNSGTTTLVHNKINLTGSDIAKLAYLKLHNSANIYSEDNDVTLNNNGFSTYGFYCSDSDGCSGVVTSINDHFTLTGGTVKGVYSNPLTAAGTFNIIGSNLTSQSGNSSFSYPQVATTTSTCFTTDGLTCISGISGGTAGNLTAWLSGSTLTATSGPTFNYFQATSTTATSTIVNRFILGTSTPQLKYPAFWQGLIVPTKDSSTVIPNRPSGLVFSLPSDDEYNIIKVRPFAYGTENATTGPVLDWNWVTSGAVSAVQPGLGRYNRAMMLGYNCDQNGVRENTADVAWCDRWETAYEGASGVRWLERHVQYTDLSGTTFRPLEIAVFTNPSTGVVTGSQTAYRGDLVFSDRTGGTVHAQFFNNGTTYLQGGPILFCNAACGTAYAEMFANGTFEFYSNISFANNFNFNTYNQAGTALDGLIKLDTKDKLQIGFQTASAVDNTELHLRSGGNLTATSTAFLFGNTSNILFQITSTGVASTSQLRIDSLADGCLNITSGVVGSTACGGGGGSNSKWATTSSTFIAPNAATRVAIGSTTPFATFAINPVAGDASNQFVIGSSSATSLIVDNSGKVALGTTTPNSNGAQLQVNGGGEFSYLGVGVPANPTGLISLGSTTMIGEINNGARTIPTRLLGTANTFDTTLTWSGTPSSSAFTNIIIGTTDNRTITSALSGTDIIKGTRFNAARGASFSTAASFTGTPNLTFEALENILNDAGGYTTTNKNTTVSNYNNLQTTTFSPTIAISAQTLTASTWANQTTLASSPTLTSGTANITIGGYKVTNSASTPVGNTTAYAYYTDLASLSAGTGATWGFYNNSVSNNYLGTGLTGIASTSPWANLAINPTAGVGANQFVIGSSTKTSFIVNNSGWASIGTSSTPGLFTVASTSRKLLLIDSAGHYISQGPAPSLSCDGTGSAFTGNPSDRHGTITVGTGVGSCTVTFAVAYNVRPDCIVTTNPDSSAQSLQYTITASSITTTMVGEDGAELAYICEASQ